MKEKIRFAFILTSLSLIYSCAGKKINKPIRYEGTNQFSGKIIGVLFDELRFKRTQGVGEDDLQKLVKNLINDLEKYSDGISFCKVAKIAPNSEVPGIIINETLKQKKQDIKFNFSIPAKHMISRNESQNLTHLLFIDEINFDDVGMGSDRITHVGPNNKVTSSSSQYFEYKSKLKYIIWDYDNNQLVKKNIVANVFKDEGLNSNPNQIVEEANMFAKQILVDLENSN